MRSFLRRIEPVWRPHPGQLEFLESGAKIKVLACGRRWGKTDACAVQVLAALHQPNPTKHLLIAPTKDQAKILFARVVELLERMEALPEVGGGCVVPPQIADESVRGHNPCSSHSTKTKRPQMQVRMTPYPTLTYKGHTVSARSGHIGRSLRGNEATHIVIDEAAFVPEDLVTEVAMPMLATTSGSLTMISTPRGMNHFWRFFGMGVRGEHGIWARQAPSGENPRVSADFLAIQRELISERAYAVEYDAEFIEIEGAVFRKEAVEACTVPKIEDADGDYFIGIDWARHTDYTAVAVLQGTRELASLVELQAFNQIGWVAQVERVAAIVNRYPNAVIAGDATGIGDGIMSFLKNSLPAMRMDEIKLGRQSKDGLIDNLNTLVEGARLRFEPDPRLLRELEQFHKTADGKQGARSGYHDDTVIALALAAGLLPHAQRSKPILVAPRTFARNNRRIYAIELV